MNLGTLFATLHRERLVGSADVPAVAHPRGETPWFMRIVLGFTGWIAGFLLMCALGGAFTMLFREGIMVAIVGAGFCVVAAFIYRAGKGEIIQQMALAISMAGQSMFAYGLFSHTTGFRAIMGWELAIFQLVLVLAMRNFLHRFLSTLFAAAAMYGALYKVGTVGIGALGIGTGGAAIAVAFALVWLLEGEWRSSRNAEAWSAFGIALGVALTAWPAPLVVLHAFDAHLPAPIFEGIGYGLGLLVFALGAARGMTPRALALLASLLLVAACHRAPGVIASTLVLLAAFGAGQRVLAGWAILALFGYLGVFYYQLDQTLLVKAGTLAMAGAVLLVMRLVFVRLYREQNEEGGEAHE
jgi:uncharacterized membrane protein